MQHTLREMQSLNLQREMQLSQEGMQRGPDDPSRGPGRSRAISQAVDWLRSPTPAAKPGTLEAMTVQPNTTEFSVGPIRQRGATILLRCAAIGSIQQEQLLIRKARVECEATVSGTTQSFCFWLIAMV